MKNSQRNLQNKRKSAKQRKRRQKARPEATEEQLTIRQINRILAEQEKYLKCQPKKRLISNRKTDGNFERKVAVATDDPLLSKPVSNPKKQKKKKQYRERGKGKPLMREIIRPFPQGRRLLTRIPTAKNPLTYKEYQQYLKSEHWQQFKTEYIECDSVKHECYVCGSSIYDLHHWTYDRISKEDLRDVIPLCREHHTATHKFVKQGVPLAQAHTYTRERYVKKQLK